MLIDAPAARLEHRPGHGLERVERAEQVGLEHVAPVVEAHPHDQVVAGDAGVVDEDVDLAEGLEDRLDQRLGAPRRPGRPSGSRAPGGPSASTSATVASAAAWLPRKLNATSAPWRASRSTIARPMPREPPVTSAVLPERSIIRAPPEGRGRRRASAAGRGRWSADGLAGAAPARPGRRRRAGPRCRARSGGRTISASAGGIGSTESQSTGARTVTSSGRTAASPMRPARRVGGPLHGHGARREARPRTRPARSCRRRRRGPR